MENKNEIVEVKESENKVALRSQEGLVALAQNYLQNNGSVILPPNYDVNDAVKALYLKALQTTNKQGKPALDVCTRESIEQVVQNYVSRGLNVAKNQCYLVCYGNTLTLQDSYFGKEKQAKAYAGVTINSSVYYEGEEVSVESRTNATKVIHYKPDVTKWDTDKIAGAFAVAVNEKGEVVDSDLMPIKEIRKSWAKSQSGGAVHKEFPVEMARKTVIGRLAKGFINTSDDSNKFEVKTDLDGFYVDEEMNADLIIEDTQPKKPAKPSTDSEEPEMVIEELDGEETKEIKYSEFKNNKTKYRAVPNSYDEERKTIRVYC